MKNKKVKKKKEEIIITTANDEVRRLIKVTVVVLVIFAVFFILTYMVTKKEEVKTPETNNATEIQYDEILVGELLNQNNNEYYVLVKKEDDQFVSLYNSYISIYKGKDKSLRFYNCDLDSVFNKNYIADESQFSIAKIKDIRFKETTILKVKNKQITNHYEGKEEIINLLKQLIK